MIQECLIDPSVAAPGNGWVKDYEEDCSGNAIPRTYNVTLPPMSKDARLLIKTNDLFARGLKVRNVSHEYTIPGNLTGITHEISFDFLPGEDTMDLEVEISAEAISKAQSYPGLFCSWWPKVCARPDESRIYKIKTQTLPSPCGTGGVYFPTSKFCECKENFFGNDCKTYCPNECSSPNGICSRSTKGEPRLCVSMSQLPLGFAQIIIFVCAHISFLVYQAACATKGTQGFPASRKYAPITAQGTGSAPRRLARALVAKAGKEQGVMSAYAHKALLCLARS